jgi:acetyl-CoA carboxylase carboxyltransferase component
MFLTGPEVIKAVTGRATTMAEVGGAEMHATVSGNAHFIAEDDRHAIALVKQLLSYLPRTTPRIRRTTSIWPIEEAWPTRASTTASRTAPPSRSTCRR